jgi:DNA helicase-2/ATP-dependent DNA helicase PcrA
VTDVSTSVTISSNDLADALGIFRPTDQQRAVIEADLAPALVVAGAGSGKTETMAARVLWLLANGHVKAGEILGLTFTRKAAGELAERIRKRIAQLAAAGLMPDDYDEFDPPTVATYNSFANTIYRDHATLIGRESDGVVLGDASSWQLARRVVVASTDQRLPGLGKNVDTVTRAVRTLSHAMSENVVDAEELRAMAEEFVRLAELPPGGRGAYQQVDKWAATVGALPLLADLADQFAHAKLMRGFVEYADQVALALEVVRRMPRVAEGLRTQYRVVLLDEYQDTSVVQTWLLSELFGGHPVMAVGDPNQSIYGWRGASAANLEEFARQFGVAPDSLSAVQGEPARQPGERTVQNFALSTSWRNGHTILAAANTLVSPLLSESRVRVERLQPGPQASQLPIAVAYEETLRDEAGAVALWLKQRLAESKSGSNGEPVPPTAAILFRARKTQAAFIAALRQHGVPYHVLGFSGLLEEPEIADLVSALTVVSDPDAGAELVRLLAGSRWRIGARDLHVLAQLARQLADRDLSRRRLDEELRQKLRDSVADGEGGSIVEAVDFVATAKPDHDLFGLRDRFSPEGLDRLREAGALIARLRARAGLELLDFVTVVQQELMLDIEVAANESRASESAGFEAFFDALTDYLAVDDSASLSGFLAWLREAEWRDGLTPRTEPAEEGTVQLLTIHGAKGLEWDVVAVPRMVHDELPAAPVGGTGAWLSLGALPYEFRGDAAELPEFPWRRAQTRKELVDLQKQFTADVGQHLEKEERRLAYVAVTRARHSLMLSGSFWASQTSARAPSPFLTELEAAGVIGALPTAPASEDKPEDDDLTLFTWPMDPLGERRRRVEWAAQLVRATQPGRAGAWEPHLDLLLEERRRRLSSADPVELPIRVPASRFKDYVTDPASVASALRRPMPERPYRATRLGTLFHSWVEDRYGVRGSIEALDAFEIESDGADESPLEIEQLRSLQETFERSPWATLTPVDVERELHLPLDDRIIVCKLDAVYRLDDGRYQVVDWKTGKAPRDSRDLEDKQLQLALYRQAYAEWKGIDPQQIDAVFYYVADDAIIRPERIFSRAELETLWRESQRGEQAGEQPDN